MFGYYPEHLARSQCLDRCATLFLEVASVVATNIALLALYSGGVGLDRLPLAFARNHHP